MLLVPGSLPPVSPGADLSFDLQAVPDQQFAVSRLNLSGDRQALETDLIQRGQFLQVSQAALDTAPARAMDFVNKIQDLDQVSFGAGTSTPLSPAEMEALRWITHLEAGPGEVSFAAGDQAEVELEQANRQFQDVVERMLQQVSHFAWVETLLDGQILAHTVVNWAGDMQTSWQLDLDPDDYRLHRRALHQALATRNILVHACLVTTQSAAKLAVLLTNPAGALMALPVAWKLVQQILIDIEKYQEITAR